jgi:hypothetical protein
MVGETVVRCSKPDKELKAYAKVKNRDADNVILSGPIRRHSADWFNSIMDRNVSERIDKIAQNNADAAINLLRLRIV